MKNKATHYGTCQACGSRQKLPNGVLAKHGYTVDWGFFSGVCGGAGHQPFEVSCDLIKTFIKRAQDQRKVIVERQSKLRQRVPDGTIKAWFHDYKRPGWGRGNKGGYVWREIEITLKTETIKDHTFKEYTFVNVDNQQTRLNNYIHGHYEVLDSIENLCTHLNGEYANSLQKHVDEIDRYVKWQTERVTSWKPGVLEEVK